MIHLEVQSHLFQVLGEILHFSAARFWDDDESETIFDSLLSQLEVCHHNKSEKIKVSNFGYLHNESKPSNPIQWVPDTKYLRQLHVLLFKLGYTTNYQEETQIVNGKEKRIRLL